MIADRHHHFGRVEVFHTHARQDLVREQRARLGVTRAVDAVADVVQVSRDPRELHAPRVAADLLHDLARPAADDARMAHRMLGKAEGLDLALGDVHDRLHFGIVFDIRDREQRLKFLHFDVCENFVVFFFRKGDLPEGRHRRGARGDARPQDLVEGRALFEHHGRRGDHAVARADRRIDRDVDALAIVIFAAVGDDRAALAQREQDALGALVQQRVAALEHILARLEFLLQRALQLVLVGFDQIQPRAQRGQQLRPFRIGDLQRVRRRDGKEAGIVTALHALRQAAGNDHDAASLGKISDNVDQLVLLVFADTFADVVDFGEHGLVVDKLVVLADAALVPDKDARHALAVEGLLELGTVFIVHEARRVALPVQARHADRDVERRAGKTQRLVLDVIDLADVERIDFDRNVRAWIQTDCQDHLPLSILLSDPRRRTCKTARPTQRRFSTYYYITVKK